MGVKAIRQKRQISKTTTVETRTTVKEVRVKRMLQRRSWEIASTSENLKARLAFCPLLSLAIKITIFACYIGHVKMDRIIGIDFGLRRTGIAVSDPLGVFASALDTVDSTKIIEYLEKYSQSQRISSFVVGYPVNMDGTPSEALSGVEAFVKRLQKAFPDIPVTLEDERFTSVLAHRVMIDGGMKASRRRDKAEVDRISAAIILQSYLDRSSGTGSAVNPEFVPESLSRNKTRKKR